MSNKSETKPVKLKFWKRLALAFEAIQKTETEYMWDEIVKLRHQQSVLEKKLQTRSQS